MLLLFILGLPNPHYAQQAIPILAGTETKERDPGDYGLYSSLTGHP